MVYLTPATSGGVTGMWTPLAYSESLGRTWLISGWCGCAGSELSFSRWLFAFSLVTTLFFTCEPLCLFFWLDLRRLTTFLVGGFAYGVSTVGGYLFHGFS
jgi:hypothetical protein